jgi:hypothetical protein
MDKAATSAYAWAKWPPADPGPGAEGQKRGPRPLAQNREGTAFVPLGLALAWTAAAVTANCHRRDVA